MTAAIEEAFRGLDARGAPHDLAKALSERIGVAVTPEALDAWWESEDADVIAARLLRLPAHMLRRLGASHDELVELARRFMGKAGDEHLQHADWYTAVFDANVPHPAGSSLAFQPPASEPDPTPVQVTTWATAYRPIVL